MKSDKSDFAQGSIPKKLALFMLPILGALVLQAAYGAVDLLVVGRFGTTSGLSAVSTGSQVLNLVTFVVTQFAMGITVLIARYLGEKHPEYIGQVVVGGTVVSAITAAAQAVSVVCAVAMLLKKHALPRTGVIHGFAGSLQQAERFVQLGYKIGVGGTITYPRASKTREVMARLPLSALLLETDAPDMPLNGFQGQPNRPEQAARVFEALCELRPESPAAIEEGIMHNTLALFSLPPVSVW